MICFFTFLPFYFSLFPLFYTLLKYVEGLVEQNTSGVIVYGYVWVIVEGADGLLIERLV